MLYKFRLSSGYSQRDCAEGQLQDFCDEICNAIDEGMVREEIRGMVDEWDHSSIGRTVTTDKMTADMFLWWISSFPSWYPAPHPMKWRCFE